MTTEELLQRASKAKYPVASATPEMRMQALFSMADALRAEEEAILCANREDVLASSGSIPDVMIDRLKLDHERIKAMADGIRSVAALPDPVGNVLEETVRPNGLVIQKVSVPMGVIAIIYESRPNVTSDAAALTLKAGSVGVLRSGKEAHRSAEAIVAAMKRGLASFPLLRDALFLVEDTSRSSAETLMKAHGSVDLLVPRGGKGLIRACVENASVPVLETGTGICHIYVDESADEQAALTIIENAKCSRPSVCNAEEVLLIHKSIASSFLPKLKTRLVDRRIKNGLPPVELRADRAAYAILSSGNAQDPASDTMSNAECTYVVKAGPDDFDTEFLDYRLAVAIVPDVDAAIDHINAHSTHHSEAILTRDEEHAKRFSARVDSACVYVNASTRFTDGGEFGFGAEMGISTQKLHARGPVGLRELCSYKYVITGSGQIR